MLQHDLSRDVQPQPDTRRLRVAAVEGLKDALSLFRRNSWAVVSHDEADDLRVRHHLDLDRSVASGVLDRVVEKIRQHLVDTHRVQVGARGR